MVDSSKGSTQFIQAVSRNEDPLEALKDLSLQLNSKEAKLNILFINDEYKAEQVQNGLNEYWGPNVIGCTTAGEISNDGKEVKSISGVSLHGDEFEITIAEIGDLENLDEHSVDNIKKSVEEAKLKQKKMGGDAKSFALLFVDGLSNKEEILAGYLATHLVEIPLAGGSSGDGLKFEKTYICSNGKIKSNVAVLVLVTTSIPFEVFKTQHFVESDEKIVITASDPEKRIVTEIDGDSAAKSYARTLGIEVKDFSPMIFSEHPVMLKINGEYYVRSIQKVNPDESLSFYCAIDDGLVLTLAKKESLLGASGRDLEKVTKDFKTIEGSIFFECILRRLEIESMPHEEQEKINQFYKKFKAVGFYTYGEQLGSLHINQTLTGVVFGRK